MAGAAMTGGTAAPGAPSARQQAAQRAIKPPRAISQRAQRTTGAPGRPGAARTRAGRRGGNAANSGNGGAAQRHGPVAFNPSEGFLNSQQLGHLAQQITRQNMKAQIAPLRQQANEIKGTEATVAKRYGGYSNATDQLLQGVGQQADASAKTYENQAADAALKSGQALNQTGQTAASEDGGYLDPQVQAELNAQGKLAAGTSQTSLAASQAQGETSFMANLRAAAAQRALEAQHGISTQYGQQLAKNRGEQAQLIAKQPTEAKSLAATLGQQQFTDMATMQGLGIKRSTLQQDAQKIKQAGKQNQERNRLAERGQNITASRNAAEIRLSERKLAETERHNRADEQVAATKARAEVKKANGGLTTNEQDKFAGEVGSAYSVVRQMRSGNKKVNPYGKLTPAQIRNALTTGDYHTEIEAETSTGKKYWKATTIKYPKVSNQALITAAIELYYHHKVSEATAHELKSLGVPVPQTWRNGSFEGF